MDSKEFNNLYFDKRIPLLNKHLLNLYIEENKKMNIINFNNVIFFFIILSLIIIVFILYYNKKYKKH